MNKSKTVRIPLNLFDSIQNLILTDKKLHYTNFNEFILDAIRCRTEEVLKLNASSKKKEEKTISDFV